jgi:hypothetical protein
MTPSDLHFIPCSELLGASDTPTRPYEIAVEEMPFWDEMMGPSALMTVPVYLGELPDDAFPTELLIVDLGDVD